MSAEWKSQQTDGKYSLQFETDNKENYKLMEKVAQMIIDGKPVMIIDGKSADVAEVKHGKQIYDMGIYLCSECDYPMEYKISYCPNCGAKMDKE